MSLQQGDKKNRHENRNHGTSPKTSSRCMSMESARDAPEMRHPMDESKASRSSLKTVLWESSLMLFLRNNIYTCVQHIYICTTYIQL